jgi:hypothetical protein
MKTTLKQQAEIIKNYVGGIYNQATEYIRSLLIANSRRSETPLQAYRRTYTSFSEMLDRDKKTSVTAIVKPEFIKGVAVPEVILKPIEIQPSVSANYAGNPVSEFTGQEPPQQAKRY